MAKKAFDLPRDSIYVVDPEDICIIGGKGVLTGHERGKLDTAPSGDALDDLDLRESLDEAFVANVDHYGVRVPVLAAKVDGVMSVVDGRTRVRAARAANVLRKKRGELPISIRCHMQRDKDQADLIGVAISANQRRNETTASKIDKAKRMLARGASEDRVALSFGVKLATVKGWLDFEDNATAATKRAASSGKLSATAAAQLARMKDPERQNEALGKLLEVPGKRTVTAAKIARGAAVTPGKAELRAFEDALGKATSIKALTEVIGLGAAATGWIAGAEEVIAWMLTGKKSEAIAKILAAKAKELKTAHAAGPGAEVTP